MKTLTKFYSLIALTVLTSCAAPVNSTFEGARTLNKGEFELAANYSTYQYKEDQQFMSFEQPQPAITTNNNFGFRVGYGLSDRLDLKLKYEIMQPPKIAENSESYSTNYISLAPKYSFIEDKLSGSLTIAGYLNEMDFIYSIAPKFIFSLPVKNKFEPTIALKSEIFPGEDMFFVGLNLGAGFSSNLDLWSVRPEFGIMKDVDDFSSYTYYTYGIGVTYNIGSK